MFASYGQVQDHLAAVRAVAMLEKVDTLPGAEQGPAAGDGNAESEVWVSAALIWAGMSSGPSVV
jgi:hypothetical protein